MEATGGIMGAIICSKGLVEAKHGIRIENFCGDSKKLKYLEKLSSEHFINLIRLT